MSATFNYISEYNLNLFAGAMAVHNSSGNYCIKLSSLVHVSQRENRQLKLIHSGGECCLVQFDEPSECTRCFFELSKVIKVRNVVSSVLKRGPQIAVALAILWMAVNFTGNQVVDSQYSHSLFSDSLASTSNNFSVGQVFQRILPAKSAAQQTSLAVKPTQDLVKPVIAPETPEHITPEKLSPILSQATKTGRFTIPLGNVKSGPVLYVFADPNCPHCKEIEPTLASLATEYDIELFPVAVIGNEESRAYGAAAGATAMCSNDRASMWKSKVNKSEIPPGVITPCPVGITAVKTNNQIYHVAGFEGTPTLVNSSGIPYPDSLPFTREAIKNWLDSGVKE